MQIQVDAVDSPDLKFKGGSGLNIDKILSDISDYKKRKYSVSPNNQIRLAPIDRHFLTVDKTQRKALSRAMSRESTKSVSEVKSRNHRHDMMHDVSIQDLNGDIEDCFEQNEYKKN